MNNDAKLAGFVVETGQQFTMNNLTDILSLPFCSIALSG